MAASVLHLMFLSLLLTLVLSELVINKFFMVNPCKNGNARRVSHSSKTNYIHETTQNGWTTYPGLELTLNIPFEQFAHISYQISYHSGGAPLCFFTTRVKVDNVDT